MYSCFASPRTSFTTSPRLPNERLQREAAFLRLPLLLLLSHVSGLVGLAAPDDDPILVVIRLVRRAFAALAVVALAALAVVSLATFWY